MARIGNCKAEVAPAETRWCAVPVEIQALVAAWQSGAISRDTLLHNLRTGEILLTARTNEQELVALSKNLIPICPMRIISFFIVIAGLLFCPCG